MNSENWEWPVTRTDQGHTERVALMRQLSYTKTTVMDIDLVNQANEANQPGQALSLNISSGGMLVLMNEAPQVEEVFKIHVPTPIHGANTPTLAEVRWVRKAPFPIIQNLQFVGLKFLF